ncbi:MAG: LicD family protein [Ruminococcus sp.]|nr:LicD family protein [Ruminococcus sp.]
MSERINLSKDQLRSLQLKELELLKYFRDFCDSHDLTYYVCGGCLIGALRYGGFIPWDDDADVFMPRPDFEIFIKEYQKENPSERFVLLNETDETFTRNCFPTLVDTSATLIKNYQKDLDIPHGVAFDIFPIDPCPSRKTQRYAQHFWCIVYSLFRAQTIPEKHGGLMSLGSKILLGIFRSYKTRKKIWKFAEKQMTKYDIEDCELICELCAGPRIMRNEYPKELFESTTEITFEGEQFKAMKGYRRYLEIAFGKDYMTPPPKEEQVISHDLAYIDLDSPCPRKGTK